MGSKIQTTATLPTAKVGHQEAPPGCVEITPGNIVVRGRGLIGVESLFSDIVKSGVDVWRPSKDQYGGWRCGKFVVREEVAQAVQAWLNSYDGDTSGYADMKLYEYLQRMFSDEATDVKESKEVSPYLGI